MILDRIILENFGAYSGRQEASLTPKSNRPIILFGGMNGGGKTTLLDSIQLGFYGASAKVSNRKGRGYKGYLNYLSECIHRGADRAEGASITIAFRRMLEGKERLFEIRRHWCEKGDNIHEEIQVSQDGEFDEALTEHWDETMASYLPAEIAHLFFFDGEQIKELAEGKNAASIIGSAIHSLLGLDLVDRLDCDLKVFERRKREEGMDSETLKNIQRADAEVAALDQEQASLAQLEGKLVNDLDRCAEALRVAEESFRNDGGDLFLQRKELEEKLRVTKEERHTGEEGLRRLAGGALPLHLLCDQLAEVEAQVRKENGIRQARTMVEVLESRDAELIDLLKSSDLGKKALAKVDKHLKSDRDENRSTAEEDLVLDAEEGLAVEVAHLCSTVIPESVERSQLLIKELEAIQIQIDHLEGEMARIPDEDRIRLAQVLVDDTKRELKTKEKALEDLRIEQARLNRKKEFATRDRDRLFVQDVDGRYEEDARQRFLKHTAKVRVTLDEFRVRIVKKHVKRIEQLMLESFTTLLRKSNLITGLSIDPKSFEVTLVGGDGKTLPFSRLSAGERQLLATSFLWGLARASGRPIPTIIDTPLGRLDSSHRSHLIKRYFPAASHQVLLLSTDEEIVGDYLTTLQPSIKATYLLQHDDKLGRTSVKEGYFTAHEATR